jgi:ribosomal protein L24E
MRCWNYKLDKEQCPPTQSQGYKQFFLRKDGRQKHFLRSRLTMLLFGPEQPDEIRWTVDHINRIRNDDRLENLRWASRVEQQANRTLTRRRRRNGSLRSRRNAP